MPKKKEQAESLVVTTLRIERGFYGKVRIRAYEEQRGIGELIIAALHEYMEKKGGK